MAKILKRIIIILVAIFLVIYAFVWYTTPLYYPTYDQGEISRIIVTEYKTGDQLNIVNPDDIDRIMQMISKAKLKIAGPGVLTPEDSYELKLYNENNLEIVKFNPIIIVDNEKIQKEPICYTIDIEYKLFDEITALFVAAEN